MVVSLTKSLIAECGTTDGNARFFDGVDDRLDTGLSQTKGSTDSVTVYAWIEKPTENLGTILGVIDTSVNPNAHIQFMAELSSIDDVERLTLELRTSNPGTSGNRSCTTEIGAEGTGTPIFVAFVNDVVNDRARFFWGFSSSTVVEVPTSDFDANGFSATNFSQISDVTCNVNIGAMGTASGNAQDFFEGTIDTVGLEFDTTLTLGQIKQRAHCGMGAQQYFWPIDGEDPDEGVAAIHGTTVVDEISDLVTEAPSLEYRRYLTINPVRTQALNSPTLLDFALAEIDTAFVPLTRGDYITVVTADFPKWFTGYVTNSPELEYLGSTSSNEPKWGYKYQATSDEFILNLNPLGFVPPYLNTTQGAILINLAERLCPGLFDTTNVDAGETVARYVVDPTKTFSEIAYEFAESAYYSFRANDFKLYFNQVDDITPALILNCNSTPANRVNIQSSTNATPIVITASGHGLSNGDFISVTGHLTNTAANGNWEVAGVSGSTFQLVNSVGNGVGAATGMVGQFNPHFTPANLTLDASQDRVVNDCIVLGDVEPSAYVTEYFVGDGYTARFPLLSSIYGVEGAVLLDEAFGGAEVDENKWTEVDTLSDYIRVDSGYLNVIGGDGDIGTVYLQSTSPIPMEGSLRLTHGEFDFIAASTGVIASLWTGAPVTSLSGCLYGISVDGTSLSPIVNGTVDATQELEVTDTSRYIIRTIVSTDEVFRRLQRYRFKRSNGTVGEYGGTGTPNQLVFETYITEIDPTTGAVVEQTVWRNPSSLNESQLYALYTPVASSDLHITVSNITVSVPMQVELETLARDAWVPQLSQYSILDGTPVPFDLTTITGWTKKIVGPNEIDSFDGLSPAATITVSGRGKVDRANPLSTPKYNPGDAALEFFKDSTKMQSNIPGPGDILRLRYRRASVAVGRALNSSSIASEALVWGDSGYRTLTKRDVNPAPRTSFECELAAAAIVQELGFAHYEGTYTQDSHFEFTGDPLSGTVLKFANLAADMPTDLDTELITAVKSTIVSSTQNGIKHEVTFGQPDRLKKLLSGIQRPIGEFYKEDTAAIPNAADLASASSQIGALNLLWYSTVLNYTNFGTSAFVPATYLDAVRLPYLVSWHNDFFDATLSTFTVYTNTAPPAGGGFEIRYTDVGWGTTNNKNLISSGASQTFTIPRTNRYNGDYCFIRAYDGAGKYSRYSAVIRILWPGVPGPSSGINTVGGTAAHPVFQATLTTDTGNELGIPDLTNDIWGIESSYAHQISLNGTWFYRNGASAGASYVANAGSNPGPFNITETEPTGLVYTIKTVTLPGNADVTQSGFINMEPIDSNGDDIPLSTVDEGTVATFFVWVKGSAGDKIRLNIKDDLGPGVSAVPYGFYSRTDYTLPDSGWYPLFTRAKIARNTAGNFNVVIHNVGTSSATINYCIESLGIAFYDYADITLGASADSPGLLFNYDNSVRKEVYVPIGVFFYNTVNDYSRYSLELQNASPTTAISEGDDWINVVRDLGVLGDGSDETSKIQEALDSAAAAVVAGSGKRKVLIPSDVQVCVGPIEDDLSDGSFFGPMGVCLWIDSGVTLRIDGVLRACYDYTYAYPNDFITILETRNSFVGALTNRDESIVIEGNGVIDLEGIYSDGEFTDDTTTTKQIKNICALRSYKADKITVKDLTIKHGIFHKLIHGFSNHVEVVGVKFHKALKYESNAFPVETDTALVTLDVCDNVRVAGCISRECGVYFGVSSWASKEVIVSENRFSDLISGDGSSNVNARGTGFWFIDYGMEYVELDMAYDQEIYNLAAGLDARTLVVNNAFCRNGRYGIEPLGAAWASVNTKGFLLLGNIVCSNGSGGIYYDGLEDYLFADNLIDNNGWGLPLQFD